MSVPKRILAVLLATTFLLSSLLLNFIQLFLFLTLKRINLHWYRTVNYYVIYSSWSQVVALSEWWSGSTVSVYADKATWEHFGKEHAIAIMNHKYEIDWALCWMVVDKLGILGGAKTFAKASLKKLPIIGWGWTFCEMIFLERSWEKDSITLPAKLDIILDYKDTKCLILLFAEGTRFTPEKHAISVQFAKERNFPELKYHLLPRAKGFNLCVKHLKGKSAAVYNIQVAFSKGSAKPTASSLLWGNTVQGHMYVNRILLDEIPTHDEELCTQWLYDLYKHKDQLMDGFEKKGYFPGERRDMKRRVSGLLNLVGWALVLGSPMFYYLLKALLFGSSFIVAIAATIIACMAAGVYMMMRATEAHQGSSYGTALSPTKSPVRADAHPLTMEPIMEESSS